MRYNRIMTPNSGAYPIDPNSAVGQFRVLAGDSVPISCDEETSTGYFDLWSDTDIEAFIALHPKRLSRAIGTAYQTLASQAAIEAKYIKDNDLQIDTTKRSDKLLAVARMWFERADNEELESGIFEVFDLVPGAYGTCPEGAPCRRDICGCFQW